jgi:histidyl-tRNA synthetase
MLYSRPSGFADHPQAHVALRRSLENRLLQSLAANAFIEVDVPSLEFSDLYLQGGLGVEQARELFEVRLSESRLFPGESDTWIPYSEAILRPDLTTPLSRRYLLDQAPRPARWCSVGQVFRNGSNPEREFRQLGAELFGESFSDTRLLQLAVESLKQVMSRELEIRLGPLQLLEKALKTLNIAHPESVLSGMEQLARARHLQAASSIKQHDFLRSNQESLRILFERLGEPLPDEDRQVLARLPEIRRQLLAESVPAEVLAMADAWPDPDVLLKTLEPIVDTAPFLKLLSTARAFSSRVKLLPEIRRGLGYYTGFTFEIHAPLAPGEQRTTGLCGGGSYTLLPMYTRLQACKPSLPSLPLEALSASGFAIKLDALTRAAGVSP